MTLHAAPPFARNRLIQYFFFGVFLLILYQLLLVMSPFSMAVLAAAILALLVHPLHERVGRRIASPNGAAAATTTLTVLLVVVPCLAFGWAFLKDAARLYPAIRDWLQELPRLGTGELRLTGALDVARRALEAWHIDIEYVILKNLADLRGEATGLAAAAITNTLFLLFDFTVLAFTLYFFLRDGEAILGRVVELVPMAAENKEAILSRLRDTLIGLVRGVFGLAVVQGVLNGVGFALVGVPLPALLGMLTTLLSPIPFMGVLGVLIPLAIAMSIAGSGAAALLAAVWCLGISLWVERVLRPRLVRPENEIPVLLLFFGLLGGMRVYGLKGVLLGPVLITLTLAFVNVYRREYHWLLEPDER